jgi:Na+/H+ antiporter NhaA
MSIFIAELSFPGHADYLTIAKAGIIFGSLAAGLMGGTWLWFLSLAGTGKRGDVPIGQGNPGG